MLGRMILLLYLKALAFVSLVISAGCLGWMIFPRPGLPVRASSRNRFTCYKTWSGGCARFHGRMILPCVLKCVSPAFSELEALSGWFCSTCACDFPPVRWGLLDFMLVQRHLLLLLRGTPPPLLLLVLATARSALCGVITGPHNRDQLWPVFATGPELRRSAASVRRTRTAIVGGQCSLPDPNRDRPRPWFATGPEPPSSAASVCYWTRTAALGGQCSPPDPNILHEDMHCI